MATAAAKSKMKIVAPETQKEADSFQLTAPEAVTTSDVKDFIEESGLKDVSNKQGSIIKLSEEKIKEADSETDKIISAILSVDQGSEQLAKIQKALRMMGHADLEKMTNFDNAGTLVNATAKTIEGSAEGKAIGETLVELKVLMDDITPGNSRSKFNKFVSKIPIFGKKVVNKMHEHTDFHTHIEGMKASFAEGHAGVMKRNEQIELEKRNIWNSISTVEQYIVAQKFLDEKLTNLRDSLSKTDPERAKMIDVEFLFYVKQRQMDLIVHVGTAIQTYQALDASKKVNDEILKMIDRASTTGILALKNGLFLAAVNAEQSKHVEVLSGFQESLEKINNYNAEQLQTNVNRVIEMSSSSLISEENMVRNFQLTMDALEKMDNFKIEAIGKMSNTVNNLTEAVDIMKGQMDKYRSEKLTNIDEMIEQQSQAGKFKI